MKILLKRILVIITVLLLSCEDQGIFVKCPDCTAEEPMSTDLVIKLDIGYVGANIEVNVYEGNLEDSVLYTSTSATGTEITLPVTINKKYTVTARYFFPDKTFIAVDSATPRVRYDKSQCNDPCYFVYDKIVNLRLHYKP